MKLCWKSRSISIVVKNTHLFCGWKYVQQQLILRLNENLFKNEWELHCSCGWIKNYFSFPFFTIFTWKKNFFYTASIIGMCVRHFFDDFFPQLNSASSTNFTFSHHTFVTLGKFYTFFGRSTLYNLISDLIPLNFLFSIHNHIHFIFSSTYSLIFNLIHNFFTSLCLFTVFLSWKVPN